MKNLSLIIILLLVALSSFAQKITRGPNVGEIYFLGPTHTGTGLYHSTDFGETIICNDSITQITTTIASIVADKDAGGLYYTSMNQNLYYSNDYGTYGSWQFKSSDISYLVNSGVESGLIFDHVEAHSFDYGNTFFNHSLNGYFGELLFSETDSLSNIGYVVVEKWGEWDTLFLLISYDTFENVQLQNAFYRYEEPIGWLSRGFKSGELFSLVMDKTTVKFSNDFGYVWEVKNKLYLNNYTNINISGGRQPGEVYLLVTYIKQMGQRKHIYIYHSLDYGETFTIHHPFSFGPDPFFIRFDAEPKTGLVPLNVQFTDESSGEDLNYAWDFNNDGIYDSYERDPAFVYADTGRYSVKLKVTNPDNNDSITKYGYIYVKDTTTLVEDEKQFKKMRIYPVPAYNKLFIELPCINCEGNIEIFDINGKSIIQRNKIKLLNELNIGYLVRGIYLIKISINNTHQYHKFIKN